ncbi:MAG: L-seryl-tRNA(Sec) selenium transferase [Armatimonadota bacterium]|nr:L-seryl-tRNA(Sec) selenium transferase [Armatimonadota bacterium]MDR7443321.1 L-seryl-tRNA(Sec) selenium transferase [Armatimonadota bacterium]MDR7570459.1 L-seryl-tRNA(Sec) selenium transferase [Armatimonadota bacterium]MDR7614349.1 L-seryl-tRNA(Sec) selenium transferase [Armatimonadota bacterium]
MHQHLRQLPSVDRVLSALRMRDGVRGVAHAVLVRLIREVVEEYRAELQRGNREHVDLTDLAEAVETRIQALVRPSLRRVLNATGALLHTNLGRAPLAPEARRAVLEAAGACNLELDLASGERGSRQDHVTSLLRRLTGAEGALVVNNNAAAVLLALSALASGREVVVARSEQVEIGDSFRMPDVMRAAGVRLVEVGTTNRVYLRDYEAAITPDTALLLKVHRSNFRIVGFVADVPLQELVHLGRRVGVPVMYDLGSGGMVDLRGRGLPYEPSVPEAVASGCDLVLFSGDKLLGGPQSGILVGRTSLLERLRTHPLYRVVRVDKLDLAALEATLRLYLDPEVAWQRIPVLRMLGASVEDLQERAERLARRLREVGVAAEAVPSEAEAGGGSLPGMVLPSYAVRLRHSSLPAHALAARLRTAAPPILARVQEEAVLLDLRSVLPEDDPDLEAGLVAVLAERS